MTATIVAKSRRLLAAVFVLAAGSIVAGCGSSSNTFVSGKVYYQDKLVKGGNVVFVGKMWSSTSVIKDDGSYAIVKVPTGKVKITVDTSYLKPNPKAKEVRGQIPADAPRPPGRESSSDGGGKDYTELPEKYADKTKTDLTYEIKPGKQEFDIKMK